MNPCGQYRKRGSRDQVKTSVWVPALNDLVNPDGSQPVWALREGGETENSVLDFSIGGGSCQPTGYAPNLWRDRLEIKICDSAGPN